MEGFDVNNPQSVLIKKNTQHQETPEENTLQEGFDINSIQVNKPQFLRDAYKISQKEWTKEVDPLLEDFNRHGFNYTPDQDIFKILVENQSNGEQFANAMGQTFINEIALGTLKGLADITLGLPKLIATGEYDNAVGNVIKGWQDNYEQTHMIYADPTKDISNGGLADFGWWMKNIPSIASTLSLLIPSGLVVKGVGMVGKIGKVASYSRKANYALAKGINWASRGAIGTHSAYRGVKTGLELTAMAGLQRFSENYQEAQQVYADTNVYAKQRLNNMSDEEYNNYIQNNAQLFENSNIDTNNRNEVANFIAKQSADTTFAMDWSNAIFDVVQMYALRNVWKGISQVGNKSYASKKAWSNLRRNLGKTESEIEQARKSMTWYNKLGEKVKDSGKLFGITTAAELSEGIEEAVNYIAQEEGMTYGKILLNEEIDKGFSNRLNDYMKSPQLYESAFWGVLGGVVFQGIGSGLGRLSTAVKRKYNEMNDKEIKDANGNFIDYFEENDTKRNKTAASSVLADFNRTIDNLKQIDEMSYGEHVINGEKVNLTNDADKENVKKKLFNEFIARRSREAIESGTINDFKEFVNSKEVQDYFIEQGISTTEDAASMTSDVSKIIDKTQKNYNTLFEKLFDMSMFIDKNSDQYKDNPFGKTGIPIEYLEILVNKEFAINESIMELTDRIERNRTNLTSETPNHDSNSFRDRFYNAVQNDNSLTEKEKQQLLSTDLISVVDTYFNFGHLSNLKDKKKEILNTAKKEKRKLNIDEESELKEIEKAINMISTDLGIGTTKGYYNLISANFNIYSLYKPNSKRLKFIEDVFRGLPIGEEFNEFAKTQLSDVRLSLQAELKKPGLPKEYKEILDDLSKALNQEDEIAYNVVQEYLKSASSYETFLKIKKLLEEKGLSDVLSETRSIYSDNIASMLDLSRDKIALQELRHTQITTPQEFYENVTKLHKNFETAANTAVIKSINTLNDLYKEHHDKATQFIKAIMDIMSGHNIDIKEVIPELTSNDVQHFNDAISILKKQNPTKEQLAHITATILNCFNRIDKNIRDNQENNSTNQNLENQSENKSSTIIPNQQPNSNEQAQTGQNGQPLVPTSPQQTATQNNDVNNKQIINAAYKFKETPTAYLYFNTATKQFEIRKYNKNTKESNQVKVLRQSSVNENVYEVDVQASIESVNQLFDYNDSLANLENYIVESRPIITVKDDGSIEIAKGTLIKRTTEDQQFGIKVKNDTEVEAFVKPKSITSTESKEQFQKGNKEEIIIDEIPTKEEQEKNKIIQKEIIEFIKSNIDKLNDKNYINEFSTYFKTNHPDIELTKQDYTILKSIYNRRKKINKENVQSACEIMQVDEIVHSTVRAKCSQKVLDYNTQRINKLLNSIITRFTKEFKLVTAEVDGKKRIFINTHQLYNYIKSITDESIADNIYDAVYNYFKKYDTKYCFTNSDFISINKLVDSAKTITEFDVNLNGIEYKNLEGLKAGDVLITKQIDNNTLGLYNGNTLVGTMFIPNIDSVTGDYKGSLNNLEITIRKDPKTQSIICPLMSDIINIIQNPNNNAFISLLSAYTYQPVNTPQDKQTKDRLFNQLCNTSIIQNIVSKYFNKQSNPTDAELNNIINGLCKIYRYVNYEFAKNNNPGNTQQFTINSIINWFTKVYESYNTIHNYPINGTVTVSSINEGQINRYLPSEKNPNDLKTTLSKVCPNEDLSNVSFVYHRNGFMVKESKLNADTSTGIHGSAGNTGIIIYQRNNTQDYVITRGKTIDEVYHTQNQNSEIRNIIEYINTYIANSILDFKNKKITSNDLYNKLLYVLPGAKMSGCRLLRNISISITKNGSIAIVIGNKNTNNLVYYINPNELNKLNEYEYNPNGNDKLKSSNIRQNELIATDIANLLSKATFDIDFNLMQHLNSGCISFNAKNQMVISIPSTGEQKVDFVYDSYSQFLFNNSCCNIYCEADENGNIYTKVSDNPAASQVLRVNMSHTTSPVGKKESTTSIAKSNREQTVDEVKKILADNKGNKGVRIAKKIISLDNKIYKKLNGKVNDIINILTKYNLLPDNIIYYDLKNDNYLADENGNNPEFTAAYKDGVVYVTDIFFDTISDEHRESFEALKKLIHEQIHGALSSEENKHYISQIAEVYNIYKTSIENGIVDKIIKNLPENDKVETDPKAFLFDGTSNQGEKLETNLERYEEFLVESLTNSSLAIILNKININGETIKEEEKSLFQQIMEFLSNIFNFKINDNSLYAKEFNLLADVLTPSNIEQEVKQEETQETQEKTVNRPRINLRSRTIKHSTVRTNQTEINNNDNNNNNINEPVKDSKNYTVSYYNNMPTKENNVIFADRTIIDNSKSREEIVYQFVKLIRQAKETPDKQFVINSSESIDTKLSNDLTEKDIMLLFKEAMTRVNNEVSDNLAISKTWIDSGYFNKLSRIDVVKKEHKSTKKDINIETVFDNEADLYNQFDNQANIRKLVNSAVLSIKC